MNITEKLQEKDPTLVRSNEGHWGSPFNSKAVGFSSFNDAGVEIETGEYLYSMVRILKPQNVLETGTHWGIGASYMGQALKDNNQGHLDTVEFLPEIHARAVKRMADLELTEQVTCHLMDARAFTPECKYELILLDTEPQTRFEELLKFYPSLEEGGYILIHDLHRHMHQIPNADHGFAWPFGKIPKPMQELVKSGQLRPFHFPTPRGLTGFYKPSKKDYNWSNNDA